MLSITQQCADAVVELRHAGLFQTVVGLGCSASPRICCERNVQTCMRVVLCQTKNGLPSFLALSMKSRDALTKTSSKVVMSYFAFANGRSCMFGTFDMSGNGGSGPSSTISVCRSGPTGQFGKNHLGDLNKFLPTVHGFDEFFGYLYHLDAMSDPYWYSFPTDEKYYNTYGPRSLIHSYATDPDDRDRDAALGQGRQTEDRR